jgi:hypothetical protein
MTGNINILDPHYRLGLRQVSAANPCLTSLYSHTSDQFDIVKMFNWFFHHCGFHRQIYYRCTNCNTSNMNSSY